MTSSNPAPTTGSLVRKKAEWVGWAIVIGLMWALPFVGDASTEHDPEVDAVEAPAEQASLTNRAHESGVF